MLSTVTGINKSLGRIPAVKIRRAGVNVAPYGNAKNDPHSGVHRCDRSLLAQKCGGKTTENRAEKLRREQCGDIKRCGPAKRGQKGHNVMDIARIT